MRLGSVLALAALALQLALSFGHIHAEDFAPASVQASSQAAHGSGTPADPDGDDHHGCAICATIALLGTLVVPAPPVVALPPDRALIVAAEIQRQIPLAAPPRLFQARAPPLTRS
jgi:hypothetical protein